MEGVYFGAAVTKDHRLGGKVCSYRCGDSVVEMEVWTRCGLPVNINPSHASFLASEGLLTVFGVPLLLLHHPVSAWIFTGQFFMCVYLSVCFEVISFYKDTNPSQIGNFPTTP
jgi:hypothetical protein